MGSKLDQQSSWKDGKEVAQHSGQDKWNQQKHGHLILLDVFCWQWLDLCLKRVQVGEEREKERKSERASEQVSWRGGQEPDSRKPENAHQNFRLCSIINEEPLIFEQERETWTWFWKIRPVVYTIVQSGVMCVLLVPTGVPVTAVIHTALYFPPPSLDLALGFFSA